MVIRTGNHSRVRHSNELRINIEINKSIPDCPDCGTRGVMGSNARVAPDGNVKLTCPRDNRQWITIAGTCPECNKCNGFPSDGLCGTCYGLKKLKGGVENVTTAQSG